MLRFYRICSHLGSKCFCVSHLILTEGFAHAYDFMLVFDKERRPKGDAAHGRSHSQPLRNEATDPCWSVAPCQPSQARKTQAGIGTRGVKGVSPDLGPALIPQTMPNI